MLLACSVSSINTFADTSTDPTPPCTLADINGALSQDLTCSTDGTVFFGTDITQFIINQCSGLSTTDESNKAGQKRENACSRCAAKAWDAFRAAARAGLIHPTNNGGGDANLGKIHQLCKISDHGDDGNEGDSPPESDALQNMYGQLRLCLPQPGATTPVDPAQCVACGTSVLDNALSASVINQAKYNVIKQYLPQACTRPPNGGDGDHHNPPGTSPTPSPTPGENGPFDQFLKAIGNCITTLRSNQDACTSCVNAVPVPTDGVDPTRVQQVLNYALSNCNGTFVPGQK
jgi:hypothetical protein